MQVFCHFSLTALFFLLAPQVLQMKEVLEKVRPTDKNLLNLSLDYE